MGDSGTFPWLPSAGTILNGAYREIGQHRGRPMYRKARLLEGHWGEGKR